MNKKKLYAALTATACFASTFASMPQLMTATRAAEVVYDSFDANYDGWHGTDVANDIIAVEGAGLNGSRGMTVTGRTSPSDGAASSKGLYLFGGIKYTYTMNVYSETDETFRLTLRYIDEKTEKSTVVELASKKVKAGEWAELSASYKAPKDTYEYELTLTTDSTNDFTFDEFSITAKKSAHEAYAAPAGKGLKDEFADYFRVGNILNGSTVKNSGITGIMLKDHNAIECENETKPDATIVQNGSTNTDVKVSLNSCSAIADFAVKNGMGFRGHTLVWHSQTPDWFFKDNFSNNGGWVSTSVMDQRMESYIKNMFEAFASKYPNLDLYAYDVCNEVVFDGTANQGGARPKLSTGQDGRSGWVQIYGDNSFVEKAFTYARKYAPESCKLFYNDYNEFATDKKNCIKNTILKPLAAKGVLDGMGMQSHISAAASNAWGDTNSYLAAMDDYLSLGIEVHVSELDISVENGRYSAQDQANKYKAIFQHAVDWNKSHPNGPNVTLVQVWGSDDNHSWLSAGSNGLLYDGNLQPKPAYSAVQSIIPDNEWGNGLPYTGPGSGSGSSGDVEPNEYGWYYHHTYEDSTESWTDRGGNSVAQSSDEHYTEYGNKSLFVSDRTSAWMGATYTISPRAFKAGETYSFSVHVKQKSGENVKFMMKIEYTDGSGETAYDEVASGIAPNDTWTQLVNTEYTIPADASGVKIYVETEESLCDFYMDEAIGAVGGTGIAGEGQPSIRELLKGDTDFDGRLTAMDMINERKAVLGLITDSLTLKAADVDQSGKVEVNDLVLLQEFLLGKIKTFPVNKPAAPAVDASVISKFNGITIADSWKKDGENNPLTTQRFGADPGFMVYKDRLYVYTTNDAFEYDGNGNIKENSYDVGTINCVSSSDLVNWTDHGAIPVAGRNGRTQNGAAQWAFASWAPDACWKTINGKDKFFLYFANSGGGIGVLTADSPTGPWTDPIGKALVTGSTPNCSDVVWMFDPAVFVDDDGTGYLYFGGGVDNRDKANPKTGRCVKLGDDMISLAGTPVTMETPYLFEDSSILKIGSKYYYSYCANWNVPGGNNINGVSFNSADICYMVSDNPLGPWNSSNLKGMVFANTGSQRIDNGGNNHHSIVYFKNKYYVLYHSRQQEMRMGVNGGKGLNYRSTQINECSYDASTGKLTCKGDMNGVSQLESLNVYEKVQAETMSNQSKNVSVTGLMDTKVVVKKGDWIKVSGADLSNGVNTITVKGSSNNGAAVKFCVGSPTGTVIGYGVLDGKENTLAAVESVTGKKDIYMVFSGDAEFDYWSFA